MGNTPHFIVRDGEHSEAGVLYLPYGTRTLRIDVTNETGQPRKLWLRPDNIPKDYRSKGIIRGYADGDEDLWIHWAGGEEPGAPVKTDEKNPLRDHSLRVWETTSIEVRDQETSPVYINITQRSGDVKPRTLTLRAITGDGSAQNEEDCNSTIKVQLKVPQIEGAPVRATEWRGTRLTFEGTQVPEYVSRWWPPDEFEYGAAGNLPSRLSLHQEEKLLLLKLDAHEDGTGGIMVAQVEDKDWKAGQDYHKLRVTQPELFHSCDNYYVVRLWFIWTVTGIGETHEVPDAERIDVVFDAGAKVGGRNVPCMGTDFHYQETWSRLRGKETLGKIKLGLDFYDIDDIARFGRRFLGGVFFKAQVSDPAAEVRRFLSGERNWQRGKDAHLPLLWNADVYRTYTSPDVREL